MKKIEINVLVVLEIFVNILIILDDRLGVLIKFIYLFDNSYYIGCNVI